MKNYKMEAYFESGLKWKIFWSVIWFMFLVFIEVTALVVGISDGDKPFLWVGSLLLLPTTSEALYNLLVTISMKKVTPDFFTNYGMDGYRVRRNRAWLFNSYNKEFYKHSRTTPNEFAIDLFVFSDNPCLFDFPNIDGCSYEMNEKVNLNLYFKDLTKMTEEEIILFKIDFDNYPIEIFQEYFKRKFMKNKFKKFLFKEIL